MPPKLTLEELVTSAATDLMGVTAVPCAAPPRTCSELVDYFGVDIELSAPQRPRIRRDHSGRGMAAADRYP